jgi:LysR family glycine cleavage system transcriptional activator
MPKKLPPLNALRSFEAAARHCSFRKAADELGVSHSAISHQVKHLEQYLKVELFLREAGGVQLSKTGRLYYPVIRTAFNQIDEGTRLVLAPEAPGILTVQVYSTFAIRWLIPRLPSFQEHYPDVRVRLHTSQSDVNFEHEDVDLSVMIGRRTQTDLKYDYLFSSRIYPVCSPAFLEQHGPITDPADLARHTILQVYPSEHDWEIWLEESGVTGINPDSGLQLDSYDLAFNTALQGIGVALGIEPFVNRDIEAGLLLELFPGKKIYTRGHWYLVCRKEKIANKKILAFRKWLLTEVEADPSMQRINSHITA